MLGNKVSIGYTSVPISLNEDFYEQTLIDYFTKYLGYDYLYGPNVARTSDKYDDVFLPDVLPHPQPWE